MDSTCRIVETVDLECSSSLCGSHFCTSVIVRELAKNFYLKENVLLQMFGLRVRDGIMSTCAFIVAADAKTGARNMIDTNTCLSLLLLEFTFLLESGLGWWEHSNYLVL